MTFFSLKKKNSKIHIDHKRYQTAKTILSKKDKTKGIIPSDFKIYNKGRNQNYI